jgi:AsmA protein
MTSRGKRHRPLVKAALAALALVGLGLTVPLGGGAKHGRGLENGSVRAAARDSFSLSSPLTLLASPHLVLESGTVSLASGSGRMPRTGEALYSLLMGGGADLVLDGAALRLDRAKPAEGAADAGGVHSLGPLVAALANLEFGTLTLREGTIVIGGDGGDITLYEVNASIDLERKSSLRAKGTLRLEGEQLSFDVALSSPNRKGEAPLAIRASVKGDLISVNAEGRVTPDRLQFTSPRADVSVPNLRHAARWLGASWPDGKGLGSFRATGPLEWNEGRLSFENARFSLDGNAASGALSLTTGAARPSVEGTLAFDVLDLGPYLADAKPSTTLAAASDWLSLKRYSGAFSASLIRELDADLRISAANVVVSGQTLGRSAASITIKDGKLFAELAEIELEHGGSGDGQIGIDATRAEPRYTVRGRFEAFDMGRAAGAYFGRPTVEGLGRLAVDLSGEGGTPDAILASLSGNVEIDMPEGARIGVDVDGIAKAVESRAQDSGLGAFANGVTDVDSLIARFAASSGVFTAQAVQANAGARVVTAAGTISTAERALDLTILVAGGFARENGLEPAPAAKSFRVLGPWAAPSVRPVAGAGKLGYVNGP